MAVDSISFTHLPLMRATYEPSVTADGLTKSRKLPTFAFILPPFDRPVRGDGKGVGVPRQTMGTSGEVMLMLNRRAVRTPPPAVPLPLLGAGL